MKARVHWLGGVYFEGIEGEHGIRFEGSPESGGRDRAMRPMQGLLVVLASCSAYDVVTILNKGRQELTSCVIDIEGDRAKTVPAVFTEIRMRFRCHGKLLDKKRVERAIALSVDKYCSVAKMLRDGGVRIKYSFSIEGGRTLADS